MLPSPISRRKLIETMTGLASASTTLVVAPAGYGKTCLLAELARSLPDRGVPVVQIGQFGDWTSDGIAGMTDGALTDLTSPPCLILDDCLPILEKAGPARAESFITRLPAGWRLVLASRTMPDMRFHKMVADGHIKLVSTADLRLSNAEAGQMLRGMMGAGLPQDEDAVSAIVAAAEGWPAALRLLAVSPETPGETNIHIARYLDDEILSVLSPMAIEFLMETSPLHSLCPSLCGATTSLGIEESAALLQQLSLAGGPLEPDHTYGQGWFRLHGLVRSHLVSRLRRIKTSDAIEGLHKKACTWHVAHGLDGSAIDHAILAQDWESAVELMKHGATNTGIRAFSVPGVAEHARFSRRVDALPDAVLQAHPSIRFEVVRSFIVMGRHDQASAELDTIERSYHVDGEMKTHIGLLRSQLAFIMGQSEDALMQVEAVLALIESIPITDVLTPYAWLMKGAILSRSNDTDGSISSLRKALRQAKH